MAPSVGLCRAHVGEDASTCAARDFITKSESSHSFLVLTFSLCFLEAFVVNRCERGELLFSQRELSSLELKQQQDRLRSVRLSLFVEVGSMSSIFRPNLADVSRMMQESHRRAAPISPVCLRWSGGRPGPTGSQLQSPAGRGRGVCSFGRSWNVKEADRSRDVPERRSSVYSRRLCLQQVSFMKRTWSSFCMNDNIRTRPPR